MSSSRTKKLIYLFVSYLTTLYTVDAWLIAQSV